jgi:hypothetical protein
MAIDLARVGKRVKSAQHGKFGGPLLRHCETLRHNQARQDHAPELKRIHFTFMSLNNN